MPLINKCNKVVKSAPLFFPVIAFAGTSDPSGVASLIILIVVFGPLVALVLAGGVFGWVKGGPRGFAAGAVFGLIVFLIGFAVFSSKSDQERQRRESENIQARVTESEACLREAGESGVPLSFPINKVFLQIDPFPKNRDWRYEFDKEYKSELVEQVISAPPSLKSDEVNVYVRLIYKVIEGAGSRTLQGLETVISDSSGQILAKRTNFLGHVSCLPEDEIVAIERFLRRILKKDQVLIVTLRDWQEMVPTEYPVAIDMLREVGKFEINKEVQFGKPLEIIPANWGCVFEEQVGSDSRVRCPGLSKELKFDQDLQRSIALIKSSNKWLVISGLYYKNFTNSNFSDRLIIEERAVDGLIKRKFIVRLPLVNDDSSRLGEVNVHQDRVDFVFFSKADKESIMSNGRYRFFQERIRMTIPIALEK